MSIMDLVVAQLICNEIDKATDILVHLRQRVWMLLEMEMKGKKAIHKGKKMELKGKKMMKKGEKMEKKGEMKEEKKEDKKDNE